MIVLAKLIILILCAFLQFQIYPLSEINVAIALFAMIISCIPIIIKADIFGGKGLKIISGSLWLSFLGASLFIPEFRCYLPLAVIDLLALKLFIPFVCWLIALLLAFFSQSGVIYLLLSILSGFLQFSIARSLKLNEELKKLRDNSKERELLVEEKNRRLIEKQDAELYAATLQERNRIAREIHDNVGHMLTRSILQVGAIKTINSNETLAQPLEGLHETLNTAMTNIRNSVHDLHDESLDLKSAIKEIIDSVDAFTVNLQYDMGHDVPKNIKYCFINIIKEAVNNAIKHSNGTSMDIIVQEHPAFYQLLIQDNGTNSKIEIAEGIGLTNMRDRVKNLGGNIKISTDTGFKILISIIKNN